MEKPLTSDQLQKCVTHLNTCFAMERPHKIKRMKGMRGVDENGDEWVLLKTFGKQDHKWRRREKEDPIWSVQA
jgi:hypothetical protein